MPRKIEPAEPEVIPHPTYGLIGGKGPPRPWQPVPLGRITAVAPPEKEGAGGVANLSEEAQTEIREAHEAEGKDPE